MSGKISTNNGFVTKADFTRLQAKVDALATRLSESRLESRQVQPPTAPLSVTSNRKLSGGVKSWLSSKAGTSASRTSSPDVNSTCQNCGKTGSTATDANKHIFQKRGNDEDLDRNDNQRCTKNEFNQFQADVTRDIKSLQKSVRDVQILCDDLEKSIHESLVYLQTTMDKMNVQILANIERLDQLTCQNRNRFVSDSEVTGTMTGRQKTTRKF